MLRKSSPFCHHCGSSPETTGHKLPCLSLSGLFSSNRDVRIKFHAPTLKKKVAGRLLRAAVFRLVPYKVNSAERGVGRRVITLGALLMSIGLFNKSSRW